MNPTMTLAQIRKARPCVDGWSKLLTGLGYSGADYDHDHAVSLGDIATTNGADDALWCVRCLDWSDIAVRRAVITGAVMPAVRRVSVHSTDPHVAQTIAALDRWCAGDDSVDLELEVRAAWATAWAVAGATAWAVAGATAWAAEAAAWAAEAATADATAGAAEAAMRVAVWAAMRMAVWATEAAERTHQRQDIITAFPPVALARRM